MASFRLLVLTFIRDYIGQWGASPSYDEIAAALGSNRTRIKHAVRSLAKDKLILRTPGPRGLALPDTREEALRVLRSLGWEVMADASRIAPPENVTHPTLTAVPVLDYIPDTDGGEHYGSEGAR